MNLADVLVMKDHLPLKDSPDLKKALEVAHTFGSKADMIDKLIPYSDFGGIEEHTLKQMQARLRGRVRADFRVDILSQSGSLPEALQFPGDFLTTLSRTPKVDLSTLRDVADRLGFAVMPFEYLDKRSFQSETPELQKNIEVFHRECAKYFQTYVLAPVDFYSIKQHVAAKDDLPIYAGRHADQAFMALTMTLPMFREIVDDIKGLQRAQAKTEKGLNEMSARVQELALRVERLQKEEILREAREQAMQEEIDRLRREQASFIARDPMLLAVPRGMSVLGDGFGFVGPCWGPDFPDIVATLRQLSRIDGQRDRINALAGRWTTPTTSRSRFEQGKNTELEAAYQNSILESEKEAKVELKSEPDEDELPDEDFDEEDLDEDEED